MYGRLTSLSARSTRAPTAPRASAAAAKSAPSKFGPRKPTNSAPAGSVRLSVETAPKGRSSPMSGTPRTHAASSRVRFMPRPLSCRDPENSLRLDPIAEAAARGAVDLVILVALAGDEHDVGGAGAVEG